MNPSASDGAQAQKLWPRPDPDQCASCGASAETFLYVSRDRQMPEAEVLAALSRHPSPETSLACEGHWIERMKALLDAIEPEEEEGAGVRVVDLLPVHKRRKPGFRCDE